MELNVKEVECVELVEKLAEERNLQDLSDLQLALVGGGIGETCV
jgi:hypothetical protein